MNPASKKSVLVLAALGVAALAAASYGAYRALYADHR